MASEGISTTGPRAFAFKPNANLPFHKFRSSRPINKAFGRAFLYNGDIFYSPNCSREVDVPKPWPSGTNIFNTTAGSRGVWDLDPSAFEKPAWWTVEFGWLAFLQLSNAYLDCALFSALKSRRVSHSSDDALAYSLYPSDQDAWLRLDKQLTAASLLISTHNGLYSFCPINPLQFGYLHAHPTYGALKVCLDKSLAWFPIIVARLSYLIAAAQTCYFQFESWPSLAKLYWIQVLLDGGSAVGIDKMWIDMLSEASATIYSAFPERAGIFLDPLVSDEYQPSVPWYCQYNIPVWYPWGKRQASSSNLTELAPFPVQLQNATTFFSKTPSLESSAGHSQSHGRGGRTIVMQTENLDECRKKIDKFFEERELRNMATLASETPEARDRRLARQNRPSRKKSVMYFWRIGASGYVEREVVPVSECDDMFNIYGVEQVRYDPFRNEWDVCELWGELPDDDNRDDDWIGGDDRQPDEVPDPAPDNHSNVLENDQPPLRTLIGDASSLPDRFEAEVLHVLSLYFGYTPKIPLPSPLAITNESLQKSLCQSLGFVWIHVKAISFVFEYPSVVAGLDFFLRLAKGSSEVAGDEWDLSRDNRCPVSLSERFKSFRCVTSTDGTPLYILDLKENKKAGWYLALKKACDVPVVCRLEAAKSEYDIVEFLLENGIPFHTLAPCNTLRQGPASSNRILDPHLRSAAYTFDSGDYLSYRERCKFILKHPRGRAALMHGQIPWRLAATVVPWEKVFSGPSGWYEDDKEMIVVKDSVTGQELLDDRLTEAEDQALCGTYNCLTDAGVKGQVAIRSWYMPSSIWDGSTHDHRRWTEYTEVVFGLLDGAFTSGSKHIPPVSRQPYSRQMWRDQTRGSLHLRKALRQVETTVCTLLSSS